MGEKVVVRVDLQVCPLLAYVESFLSLPLTPRWHLHQEQLLAFLRLRDMRRHIRVHVRLEPRSPPSRQTISNLPLIVGLISPFAGGTVGLRFFGSGLKTSVETGGKTGELVFAWTEVVAGTGERGRGEEEEELDEYNLSRLEA